MVEESSEIKVNGESTMGNIDQKFKDGYVPFRLTNVEVYWAHVHTPDTAFGNNKYCLEMHLSDAVAAQLKALGYDIKDKEKDGMTFKNVFKAKTEVVNKKTGEKNKPPIVVDESGAPFTENIGNGSICHVTMDAKAWQVRGSWQLSAYLKKVEVVWHVPYSGAVSFEFGEKTADVPF